MFLLSSAPATAVSCRRLAPLHLAGAVLLATALPISALAQSAETSVLGPAVVVTANRLPTPEDQVASSISVVTSDDIERKQQRSLADALRDVPGLYLAQSGGPGGSTRLFMRGTEARHTLVLIDGIEANDPSSPDGAFEFQHLATEDIDRIEVLRGPESTLYGSNAIGGVVNIITKTGSGPAKATALAEAGSFGTFNQRTGVSGSSGRFNYVLGLAHSYSNGYDITPERLRPAGATPQRDSYDNNTLSSKLGAEITDNFNVSWVSRVVRSASDFAAQPSDPNSRERTRQYFTRGEGHLALLDGRLTQTFGLGYTRYDRTSTDRPDELSPSSYDQHNLGTRTKADWQGNFALTNNQTVTGGLETKLDANDSNSAFSSGFNETTNAHTRSNAAYLQLKSSFGDSFYNTIGARIDDSDQFGAKTTYRIAPAYLVRSTGTKFKASLGTAYRAPTLFELYGADNFIGIGIFNGNPNLRPETSLGWDAGVEQTLLDSRVKFGTTYFSNKIENYITYTANFTSLQNLNSAKIHGVESFISFDVTKSVRLRADHTFTIAQDGATGGELRRRPKHKASAGIDYRPTDKATVSLTTLFVGPRVDADAVTFQDIRASSYTLVNLAGSYQLTDTWTAFGRVDNLFDRKYEDPQGFQRPGIGAFAGVRAVF